MFLFSMETKIDRNHHVANFTEPNFCFYRILVWVAAYQDSKETNPEALWDNLTKSLQEIKDLYGSTQPTSTF